MPPASQSFSPVPSAGRMKYNPTTSVSHLPPMLLRSRVISLMYVFVFLLLPLLLQHKIANEKQVQAAVKCAYNSNTKTTVKGGGHSYGAYGLAGSLVIDMVQFQAVTLDTATNVASVGGGARLGNMAKKIFDLGGRAYVPSSSSPPRLCLFILATKLTAHPPVSHTAPAPPSVSAATPHSVASAMPLACGVSLSTRLSHWMSSSRTAPPPLPPRPHTRTFFGRFAAQGRASPLLRPSTSRHCPRRRSTLTTDTPSSSTPRRLPPPGSSTRQTGHSRTRPRSWASASTWAAAGSSWSRAPTSGAKPRSIQSLNRC